MLKIKVLDEGNVLNIDIEQMVSCDRQLAHELVAVIDRIIIDEYIKGNPKIFEMSKQEIVDEIKYHRYNIIFDMQKEDVFEYEYVNSTETSLYLKQEYGV